jgi:2EXR family
VRIHIWTQALWTPRIVQLCFDGEDGYGWDIHLVSRAIPPLLHACSESRAAALMVYPHRYYEMQSASLETYINFEIDVICLTSAVLGYWFEWLHQAFDLLKGWRALQDPHTELVRHLAVNINWINTHQTSVFLACLPKYESLETLTLFVESEDPPQGETRLVEIEDSDENALWDYSFYLDEGEVVGEFDKICRIFKSVTTKSLKTSITNIISCL